MKKQQDIAEQASTGLLMSAYKFIQTKFKITALALCALYLAVITNVMLKRFNSTDMVPPLKPINTEALKALGPLTVRVKVGMFIKNFLVFDVSKNVFQIDALIWFLFNADEINLETVERFSFDNGKIIAKTPPDIKISGKEVFVKYNVIFEQKTDLNFHYYPLEDHRLPIMMTNDFVTPEEMIFMVDGSSFQIVDKIAPAGWNFRDLSVDTGVLSINLDKENAKNQIASPKALYIINVAKASARRTLVIFTPLYAMTFLGMLSYVMHATNPVGRITLATAAFTGLLGYRFVLEQMIPQVGYFTLADNVYLFLLIFSFLQFVLQLLMTRYYLLCQQAGSVSNDWHEGVTNVAFVVLLLVLIIGSTWLILF